MSKHRPASLPKGVSTGPNEGGAVPQVRTRQEIRREWEEERRRAAEAAAEEGSGSESPLADIDAAETSSGAAGSQKADEEAVVEATAEAQSDSEVSAGAETSASDGAAETAEERNSDLDPEGEVEAKPAGEAAVVQYEERDAVVLQFPATVDVKNYVEVRPFTEPESDDPRERLAHYARIVAHAEMAARANEQRAKQQKIIVQGRTFQAMKKEELWKVLGLPHFDALVQAQFGFGKNYANKIIRAAPVVTALETLTSEELAEKHLRPLCGVLETHGADAVREVWTEAARKKITEKSLQDAAVFLGYAEPVERPAKVVGQRSANGGGELPQTTEAKNAILSLRQKDEERAKQAAIELLRAAQELCQEFGIQMEQN